MTQLPVSETYGRRADEYVELLGAVGQLAVADRERIEQWAEDLRPGTVLDLGCGPGHWTDFLHQRGVNVTGIDPVPEFISRAQERFPDVPFRSGSFLDPGVSKGSASGVLAWYSLIHAAPDEVPALLGGCARMLTPGGGLLLGFFGGTAGESFPHAVTTAYYWSVDRMQQLLEQAGFEVDGVEQRQDPGVRPHAAMWAHYLG